ncbi:MAG: ABC transporter permease [Chitinophagaceae bacterium]|nr:ABC transporter permease [Chitinophagaceae bacterium]
MFRNYFKTAFRNLRRNKIYSFINVMGLSLGLACSILIILYVKDEVSFDRFHNNGKHIYRVVAQQINKDGSKGEKSSNTGYFQGPKFTEAVPEIQSFVRIQNHYADIKKGNEVSSQSFLVVDSSFFSIFTFPLLSGNAKTCLKDPYSIVITEDFAKKQFGTTDAAGKVIMIRKDDDFQPHTVTAVTKRCPQNSSLQFEALLPMIIDASKYQNPENWFNTFLNTFVVVAPHASISAVEKKMQQFYNNDSKDALKAILEKYGPVIDWQTAYLLQPYTDMHLSVELPAQNGLSHASNPMYSYILSGIALFILGIACINFINLTVARSVKRGKEIGIRKVVGGSKKQLISQFLGESFLLCFLAFLFAVMLVQLILPLFNDLANKALSISYLFDARLIAYYILLFLVTGLLAGFYPALVLSGYNPVQTLYSRFTLAGKNYLQKSLVVLQFALASFLIIATFTLYAQFNYLTTKKLGYDDTDLITVNKNMLSRNEAGLFAAELLKNPNIMAVAPKNGGTWGTAAKVNRDSIIHFSYETVNEAYIPTLKISLVQGRNFSKDFPSDSTHAVLVNESFVKKVGWKNAIGQEVNFWYKENERYTVVGVVKDYHFLSLNQEIGPQLFTMNPANSYGTVFIKIKPNSAAASLKHIEKVFKELFPFNPYTYTFKSEENVRAYEAEAKWKQIMLFSAVLTIFISCIGLFGLSVLSAEKRIKEIGIRKVLGASVNSVVTILSRDFVKLVLIALFISIPVSWIAANKWLQNYPYKITLHWSMFAAAGALVILIAIITVSFQAIKAAMANPVKALRSE